MNPYLLALKKRLEKEEIAQEVYDELVEKLKEPEEEPIEIIPKPTELEILKERIDTQDAVMQEILFDILPSLMGV